MSRGKHTEALKTKKRAGTTGWKMKHAGKLPTQLAESKW